MKQQSVYSSNEFIQEMHTELLTKRYSSQFQDLLHDAKKVLMIVKNKYQEHMLEQQRNKQLVTTNYQLKDRLQSLKVLLQQKQNTFDQQQRKHERSSRDKLIKVKAHLKKLKQLYEVNYVSEQFDEVIQLIDKQ